MIVGVLVSMSLVGCGGPMHFEEEYAKYNPAHSKAMNIALLTGLTTENGPIKDSAPVKKGSNLGIEKMVGAGANASFVGVGSGLSSAMSGLGVVSALMFSEYQPEWTNHVLAWVPADEASSPEDAALKVSDAFYNAVKSTLPKGSQLTVDKPSYKYAAWSDKQGSELRFILNKKNMAITTRVCVPEVLEDATFISESNSYYLSFQKHSNDVSPFVNFRPFNTDDQHPMSQDEWTKFTDGMLNNISPKLPSWVYIYVAPKPRLGTPAYFLNQGEKLFFVSPA